MATIARPGVLKRMENNHEKSNLPTEKKTVQNGDLKVFNVPHVKRSEEGPTGELYYVQSNVMYALSFIFRDMIDQDLKEFDFNSIDINKF